MITSTYWEKKNTDTLKNIFHDVGFSSLENDSEVLSEVDNCWG